MVVIDAALRFLMNELNASLRRRLGTPVGDAALGPLVDDKGSWAFPDNTLRLTLFLIEEERITRAQVPRQILQRF